MPFMNEWTIKTRPSTGLPSKNRQSCFRMRNPLHFFQRNESQEFTILKDRKSTIAIPEKIVIHSLIQKPLKTFMLRSGEVEAIKVHHLVPGRDEVMDKLLLRIRTSIDFSEGAELGV